jgi:putative hydrolase of the HAD superfamily
VITSEGSNSLKPEAAIFEYAFAKAGAEAASSLMIGDNLEVDIAGALAVGMDAVHVNFNELPESSVPTYTIRALKELKEIL